MRRAPVSADTLRGGRWSALRGSRPFCAQCSSGLCVRRRGERKCRPLTCFAAPPASTCKTKLPSPARSVPVSWTTPAPIASGALVDTIAKRKPKPKPYPGRPLPPLVHWETGARPRPPPPQHFVTSPPQNMAMIYDLTLNSRAHPTRPRDARLTPPPLSVSDRFPPPPASRPWIGVQPCSPSLTAPTARARHEVDKDGRKPRAPDRFFTTKCKNAKLWTRITLFVAFWDVFA